MIGWHHRLDGHGFGWTPGVCDGQGGLACYDSWGPKESEQWLTLFWGAPISLQMVIAAIKLKDTYSLEGKL